MPKGGVMILKRELFCRSLIYLIFLIVIIQNRALYAQEHSGKNLIYNKDSTEVQKNIYNPFLFTSKFHLLIPNSETDNNHIDISKYNPAEAWGMTLAELSQSTPFINNRVGNQQINLYLRNFLYTEKGTLSQIRKLLSLAEMSAVGYFAYKHIQKYGFIKNKKQK